MRITAKAQAVSFVVTGENDEVITSYEAADVNMVLDVRSLLANFSSLAHLFKQLDATHREVAIDAVQGEYAKQHSAAVQAAVSPRAAAFLDAVTHLGIVAREEQLDTDKFGALLEHADRLMAQPEFVMQDLVDASFDLFDAQTNKHWDNPRVQVAMKAVSTTRQRRKG